ncbi:MAG: B12-binding domain-containing protein [bacterium]|nr:MAG: B12-binding domain-containing protein [bacterium]
MPLYQIDKDDRDPCLNLIYNQGSENPLLDFIQYFKKKGKRPEKPEINESKISLDEKIKQRIIQGNRSGLEQLLMQKLEETKAIGVINELLIPAMKKVGDLFGAGEMQLPFVLQSAEVMKFVVDKLRLLWIKPTRNHKQVLFWQPFRMMFMILVKI